MSEHDGHRGGRPPSTSARRLELIALELFTEQGFDETTVEQIAARAGVSSRTFFRYFDSKASVLWHEFDGEVAALRAAFAEVPDEVAVMEAIRLVVVSVNRHQVEDLPELRARMALIGSVPALLASAAPHYDAWERAVSEFAAGRLGQPADSLVPARDRPDHPGRVPLGLRPLGRPRRRRPHHLPRRRPRAPSGPASPSPSRRSPAPERLALYI